VIRMPTTLSDIIKLVSLETGSLNFMDEQRFNPLAPFSEQVISYCSILSKAIMKHPESKSYADLMTFAFWIRQASMENLKHDYPDFSQRMGRGVSFHIAPSNVPLNFAYSLIAGLLSGNHSIVRVSSKYFPQTELLIQFIKETLPKDLQDYVAILKYPRNKDINDYFSSHAQVRIVWGGDQTIQELRRSPLPIRSKDIVFADRFSILLIDSDEYLKANDHALIAKGFYNDTYLFDQNACTSPRMVIWTGQSIEEAKLQFWNQLLSLVLANYENYPVRAVEKYKNASLIAANIPESKIIMMTNWLYRIEVKQMQSALINFIGNSGFFIEYTVQSSIEELSSILTDKFQTLSYFGLDPVTIKNQLANLKPKGVDRIVPLGRTMEFDLFWDGYDLIRELSRDITII
jgi:hypothetical protein